MAKKFSKFYLNRFRPITKLEDNDVRRASITYKGFTLIFGVTLGYLSYRMRKRAFGVMENYEAPRDPQLLSALVQDLGAAFAGYILGHLYACDYIYKNR